ncbi:MAG: DUF2752 domain-containing protein [Bacteroidales bacterium]|nr:DUF2752 domain-containing protein [Bacteroidales bacterium]
MDRKKKIQYKQTQRYRSDYNAEIPAYGNSYMVVNAVFAGIIILIFIYSGFFCPAENNYPVKCIHEQITGQACPSCGLSRSFSYIIRGDFASAEMHNEYGMRIFLFFLFHLVMRLSNIVYLSRKPLQVRKLIILDSSLAIISFILAFRQFFVYYFDILF